MHQLRVHGNQEYIKQQNDLRQYSSVESMQDNTEPEESTEDVANEFTSEECYGGTTFQQGNVWLSGVDLSKKSDKSQKANSPTKSGEYKRVTKHGRGSLLFVD
jgi:hypothetical protein